MSTLPVRHEPTSLVPTTQPDLLFLAIEKGATIDTIERLVAMREKELARLAEMDFNAAMNRAQAAMGPVAADLTNPHTKSKYASYAAIDNKLRPLYGREGLALSFDTGEAPAEMVRVLCHVSHASGHTRTYHVDMPSDGKGAQGKDVMTKTHAAGSAMSYGMRYLVKLIFNVAVGEDDNDGNGVSNGDLIQQLDEVASSKDLEELKRIFTDAYTVQQKAKNKGGMQALINAKNKRKAELGVA